MGDINFGWSDKGLAWDDVGEITGPEKLSDGAETLK